MNKLIRHLIAVGLALGMATTVYANDDMKMDMNAAGHMKMGMGMSMNANPATPSTTTDTALANGTIKKVDRQTEMLTIEHGELKDVGMPAMTMAYKAKDAAMVTGVKEGEKVKFRLENLNGTYTITALKKQ